MKKILYTIKTIYIILITTLLNIACSREYISETELDNLPEGYGLMKVNFADIAIQEESLNGQKKASVNINNFSDKRDKSPLVKGFLGEAILEPEDVSAITNSNEKSVNKVAALQTKNLTDNVIYRIYVFDKTSGNIIDSAIYIRTKESMTAPMKLLGNKTYTVVAYSINSTALAPPYLENKGNINTAEITNGQVEFMFQKQDIHIASNSTNVLKIKFSHQFAQINTVIRLNTTTASYTQIRGVGGASYFKPSYSKTKFKVNNSAISAVEESPQGSSVNFPFIPFSDLTVKSITSLTPTILNTPSSISDGSFIIEALTIGDVTRHVEVSGLDLTPGIKYNLILTFNVPETTLIGANPYFHFVDDSSLEGTLYSHTVELENPTYGVNIDLWYLDNSFNLNINGVNLFNRELNFEGFPLHDVYFSDNTYYGSQDIPASRGRINVIYRINELAPRQQIPVVRLTIDEEGNVRLFGRKRMSENLRDLQIKNGVTVNPNAKLNLKGNNTLIFTSNRWTITDIEGRVYGIRVKE